MTEREFKPIVWLDEEPEIVTADLVDPEILRSVHAAGFDLNPAQSRALAILDAAIEGNEDNA